MSRIATAGSFKIDNPFLLFPGALSIREPWDGNSVAVTTSRLAVILVDVLIAIYAAILILGIVAVFAFVAEYLDRYRKQRIWDSIKHVLHDHNGGAPPLP